MHITPATWVDPGASTTDTGGIRPVVLVEASSAVTSAGNPSQDAFNRLAQISIGKEFLAQVVAKQQDGAHLVRVADTTARMILPDARNPGDTFSLKLVSANPRPTFLLGDTLSTAGAEQLAKGNAAISKAQLEALTTAQQGASGTFPSTPTSLSSTGKMIDLLLLAAQLDGSPARLEGKAPLINAANTPTGVMAQAINNAVEFSGLFYESHLAEWTEGNRSLESLMREPQAKMAGKGIPESPEQLSAMLQAAGNRQSLMDLMRAIDAAQDKVLANHMPTTLNEETARLINTQLDALEHLRFAWHGEIWPDQEMEWEVSEEEPKQEAAGAEAVWRSKLKLTFPTLGEVTASVRFSGGHVQMHLHAETPETAVTLRDYSTMLATALDTVNAPLDLLMVNHGKNE